MLVTYKLNTKAGLEAPRRRNEVFFVRIVCIPACPNGTTELLYLHHNTAGSGDLHRATAILSHMQGLGFGIPSAISPLLRMKYIDHLP